MKKIIIYSFFIVTQIKTSIFLNPINQSPIEYHDIELVWLDKNKIEIANQFIPNHKSLKITPPENAVFFQLKDYCLNMKSHVIKIKKYSIYDFLYDLNKIKILKIG